jgi:tRNA (guanine37-N1)-methyltransferase
MGRLSIALIHGPVLDRHGREQTTALTNLDVHDLARSARTYECAAFYLVTPVPVQQEQARAVIGFWDNDEGQRRNPDRREALSRARVVATLDDAIALETTALGRPPLLVATSARPEGTTRYADLRRRLAAGENALVLLGTGAGMTSSMLARCDLVLAPIYGPADEQGRTWNHLSVRSAGAIILDRLAGA